MNAIVTGAAGKLGRAWQRLCAGGSVDMENTRFFTRTDADLTDSDGIAVLKQALFEPDCDLVIHTMAMTDVDACERNPEMATRHNTEVVRSIGSYCREKGAGLLFYSTDYIFGGDGPKKETDTAHPLNVYGKTKLQAESCILEQVPDHLIIRINVPLAPPSDGPTFYSFLAGHLLKNEPVSIVTDQWNNPLDTDRIVSWSHRAWQEGVRGVLHFGGGTYASRFDIARMVARYLGAEENLIRAVSTDELGKPAARPKRGGLLIDRQSDLFGTAPDLPTILQSLPK